MALNLSELTIVLFAGAAALLSPCGYPMLPGYISYYVGTKAPVEKAIRGGIACTLGLLAVFSIIGFAASIFGSLISQHIPFLELVAGAAMIVMGTSMIIEIKFPLSFSKLRAPKHKGLIGIFLYGSIYGLATLGCSGPIFFSVLFRAVASGGFVYGMITFIAYALGMGFPIIVTTFLVAKTKELVLKRIMEMTPWLQKISGMILIVIGVYLIYFYTTSSTI